MGFWKKVVGSLMQLKADMEKTSVSQSAASDHSCCHIPEEEIEEKRKRYQELAGQRRNKAPAA